MLTWTDMNNKYIVRHSNHIRKTTQPLRDRFGINYFFYSLIDNEGKYVALCDCPDWAEYYVSEQIFLYDPYLRHPSVYQSGILIDDHEIILKSTTKMLKTDKTVILVQKGDSWVEIFGFCGNTKTSSIESLSLNHPQILKSFGAHFKRELSPILNNMEDEANSLIYLKGDDFFCKQPICTQVSSTALIAFYKDLGMKCDFEKAKKLSTRERQCLKILIEDKSAKEIASLLGLSSRTIEYYLENIKDKLSCWSKQEVIAYAKIFEQTRLL